MPFKPFCTFYPLSLNLERAIVAATHPTTISRLGRRSTAIRSLADILPVFRVLDFFFLVRESQPGNLRGLKVASRPEVRDNSDVLGIIAYGSPTAQDRSRQGDAVLWARDPGHLFKLSVELWLRLSILKVSYYLYVSCDPQLFSWPIYFLSYSQDTSIPCTS